MKDLLYEKSIEHLKGEPLKHLSTLKYLMLYRDNLTVDLIEDGAQWALRYEANVRNTNSINLAQSLKMKLFLRIDHFLLYSK